MRDKRLSESLVEPSPRQEWLLERSRSLPRQDLRRVPFNLFRALKLKPAIDCERLRQAFRHLLVKYDVLRWTFPIVNERVTVRVLEPKAVDIDVVDASTDDASCFAERLARDAAVSLHEIGGPLISLTVYLRPNDTSIVLLRFFHAIVDGLSIGLIVQELVLAYLDPRGVAEPKHRSAPFSEFAAWQRQFTTSSEGERALTYWRNKLCDVPRRLSWPSDRPDTASYTTAFTLDKEMGEQVALDVSVLAQSQGNTPYRVLLGACMATLYALTGVADIPVTSSVINRKRLRFRDTIGWIANGIIFRERFSPDESVREFLQRLSSSVDEALEHQEVPYHFVQEAVERDFPGLETAIDQVAFASDAPIRHDEIGFNWFVSQPPGTKMCFGGYEIESVPVKVEECLRDLTFYARQSKGSLNISLNVRGDMFSPTDGQRILDLYAAVLVAMVGHPTETIQSILAF